MTGLVQADEVIAAAVRVITHTAFELIYADPHQWSTRPCQTCRAVTAILGKPFGCERYRIARESTPPTKPGVAP
jgi:hypothetical protein